MIAYKMPNEPKIYQICEKSSKVNYTRRQISLQQRQVEAVGSHFILVKTRQHGKENGTNPVKLHKILNRGSAIAPYHVS